MEAEVEDNKPEDGYRYTVVIKKLNNFCKNKLFKDHIQLIVRNGSKMAFDAYNLLNLDVLRRIENNVELPNYNSSYLFRCLTAVCKNESIKDNHLDDTFKYHFKPCISTDYKHPFHKNCSLTRSEIARQMLQAVQNHTVLNFQYRIRRFVSLKYNIPFKRTNQFIYYVYSDKDPKIEEWKDYKTELLELFPDAPYPNIIKRKLSQF